MTAFVSYAQQTDSTFAPAGAEWWHDGAFYPTWDEDNLKYSFVSGDTSINGQECQIIQQWNYQKSNFMDIFSISVIDDGAIYVYEQQDTVFVFNSNFQRFTPLYVFNVAEGDTVCLPVIGDDLRPNPYANGDTCFCFVVDSVRMVLYDTTYLETVFEHSLTDSLQMGIFDFPVYNWCPSLTGNTTPNGAYARKTGALFGGLLSVANAQMVEKPTHDTLLNSFIGNGLRCYEEPGLGIHVAQSYNENCMFDTTTAIPNLYTLKNILDFYPNPVENEMHLSFNTPTKDKVFLTVTDALGRTVKRLNISKGSNKIIISLKGNAPGIYYLNLWINKQHYAEKFIFKPESY